MRQGPRGQVFARNLEPPDPGLSCSNWSWIGHGGGEEDAAGKGETGGLVRCELGAAEQITQLRNTAHFDSTFNKGESLSICLTITRPRKRAGGEGKRGREKSETATALQESHSYFEDELL